MKFSSKIEKCGLSPMRKFAPYANEAAKKGKKLYHLNIGQPDIATPAAYFDAVKSFSQPVPTVIFLVATVLSVIGLSMAMQHIPTGTAYAVWTSVGTLLTVGYSVAIGAEPMSWLKGLLLLGIVGCVVGLKQLDSKKDAKSAPTTA